MCRDIYILGANSLKPLIWISTHSTPAQGFTRSYSSIIIYWLNVHFPFRCQVDARGHRHTHTPLCTPLPQSRRHDTNPVTLRWRQSPYLRIYSRDPKVKVITSRPPSPSTPPSYTHQLPQTALTQPLSPVTLYIFVQRFLLQLRTNPSLVPTQLFWFLPCLPCSLL